MAHVYLDHNATTPLATEVLEAMMPALTDCFGNSSSIHRTGQEARQLLDHARRDVAAYFGRLPEEVIFTSGGTEADNLAVKGVVLISGKPDTFIAGADIEEILAYTTPAMASEPYSAEAPSFKISTRSMAPWGIAFTLISEPRPKLMSTAATGAMRRPLISTKVPCEPKPRIE